MHEKSGEQLTCSTKYYPNYETAIIYNHINQRECDSTSKTIPTPLQKLGTIAQKIQQ